MHPELLNNSNFLRYYQQWQEDPTSIVFAAIAEYFLDVGLVEDAIRICLMGLGHHPQFVMGRLTLAKAFFQKKEWERAKKELSEVLRFSPAQPKAQILLKQVEEGLKEKVIPKEEVIYTTPQRKATASWETVTMAKIFAAQGDRDKARDVLESILSKDPSNQEAREGLNQLQVRGNSL